MKKEFQPNLYALKRRVFAQTPEPAPEPVPEPAPDDDSEDVLRIEGTSERKRNWRRR